MAITWVVKASKLCNLRCRYCYEWPYLNDRTMMHKEIWQEIISSALEYHKLMSERSGANSLSYFVWHGGEPLLLDTSYFRSILDLQADILGPYSSEFRNAIQTNLYKLDDDKIELLKEHNIGIGVSFDVVAGVRLSSGGKETEKVVLRNMERLREADIEFNCIAVMGAHTAPQAAYVYDFFANQGIGFRALPLKGGPYESSNPSATFCSSGIVDGLFEIFSRRMEHEIKVPVDPLDGYLQAVLLKIAGLERPRFNRSIQGDSVLIVDTDGKLYLRRHAYDHALGDLKASSFSVIRQSSSYLESLAEDDFLRSRNCSICDFFGACTGFPIFEAALDDASGSCSIAQPMMQRIEKYLLERGVSKELLHEYARDYLSGQIGDCPSQVAVMV